MFIRTTDAKLLFIVYSTAISEPFKIPVDHPASVPPAVVPFEGIAVRLQLFDSELSVAYASHSFAESI